jgi:hypothetical protein
MLGDFAKRVVNLAVVLLAAVAFFTVPFGRRTLFQHLLAVVRSEPAEELGREIEKKGDEVRRDVIQALPVDAGR